MSENQAANQEAANIPDIFAGEPEPEVPVTEPPKEPEQPAQPEKPPEEKPAGWETMARYARELGLDQAIIDQSNLEQLTTHVYYKSKEQASQPAPKEEPQSSSEGVDRELTLNDITFADLKLTGKPEDYDEGYINDKKELFLYRRKDQQEKDQLKKEIAELKAARDAEVAEKETQLYDNAFDGLDESYYGKGGLGQISDEDKIRRNNILGLASQLAGSTDPKQVVAKVAEADKILRPQGERSTSKEARAGYDLAQKQQEWQQGTLAQPTHTEVTEPDGYEKAVKNLQKKQQQYGITPVAENAKDDAEVISGMLD